MSLPLGCSRVFFLEVVSFPSTWKEMFTTIVCFHGGSIAETQRLWCFPSLWIKDKINNRESFLSFMFWFVTFIFPFEKIKTSTFGFSHQRALILKSLNFLHVLIENISWFPFCLHLNRWTKKWLRLKWMDFCLMSFSWVNFSWSFILKVPSLPFVVNLESVILSASMANLKEGRITKLLGSFDLINSTDCTPS